MPATTAERARDLLEAYNAAKKMMKEGEDKADIVADLLDRAGRSLLKAVKAADIDECRELLAIEGVDIHIMDSEDYPNFGMTPVMLACENGHLEVVEYLVSKGANINDKDINGLNSLMLASYYGHFNILEYLVSKGIDIYNRSNGGYSCLMWACYNGHVNIAQYLMSKGANIHEMSNHDDTCFTLALDIDHKGLLSRLRKWPTTMAILVLQELALIYIIDSESVIDLHQYLGRPDDLKTDNEEDYKKDKNGRLIDLYVDDDDDDDDDDSEVYIS